MKRVLIFILCTSLAAVGAFMLTRWAGLPKPLSVADPLVWLQAEFQLGPAQVAAIKQLHDEYQPVCREHCLKIQQARARLDIAQSAVGADAATAAVVGAQAELARVEAVCRDATRAHLRRVAAVMDPAQGERFLALVLPKLVNTTQDAPCGLR